MWDLVKFIFFCACISFLLKTCNVIDKLNPDNIRELLSGDKVEKVVDTIYKAPEIRVDTVVKTDTVKLDETNEETDWEETEDY